VSALLDELLHPNAWQAISFAVLHGVRSTFSALGVLAGLRSAQTGVYAHEELAREFAADTINRTLGTLHAHVFAEWLGTPLQAQTAEVRRFLRCSDWHPAASNDTAALFKTWIPDSAEPPERLLFEADLSIILTIVNAGQANAHPLQRPDHWATTAVLQRIRDSHGDIRLSLGGLSQDLGISTNYLGHLFLRHTGVTFRRYLRAIRISKGANDILSSMSTQVVSESLGYRDVNAFRRDFVMVMKRSPAIYRREKAHCHRIDLAYHSTPRLECLK
jgi:AraC-like DNA-binding protein